MMEENFEMDNIDTLPDDILTDPTEFSEYKKILEDEELLEMKVINDDSKSRSSWGSDFSYTEPEEVTILNDEGETFIISESKKKQLKRNLDIKSAEDLFLNILVLDNIYTDKPFINHLLDSNTLSIKRNLSDTGLITDYTIKYIGGEFESIGGVLTLEETDLLRENIMDDYDNYNRKKQKEKIKKAGIITAIALSIIAVITGLSVGLTRKGNDLVHKSKWEKLKPAEKKKTIPWTELREATGKILVFTGRYLTVILFFTGSYLLVKKWKKKR